MEEQRKGNHKSKHEAPFKDAPSTSTGHVCECGSNRIRPLPEHCLVLPRNRYSKQPWNLSLQTFFRDPQEKSNSFFYSTLWGLGVCLVFLFVWYIDRFFCLFVCLFLFFVFWLLYSIWSSRTRDQIWATAVAMLDPPTHCAGRLGQGWNLHPGAVKTLPVLSHHSRNSCRSCLE